MLPCVKFTIICVETTFLLFVTVGMKDKCYSLNTEEILETDKNNFLVNEKVVTLHELPFSLMRKNL